MFIHGAIRSISASPEQHLPIRENMRMYRHIRKVKYWIPLPNLARRCGCCVATHVRLAVIVDSRALEQGGGARHFWGGWRYRPYCFIGSGNDLRKFLA